MFQNCFRNALQAGQFFERNSSSEPNSIPVIGNACREFLMGIIEKPQRFQNSYFPSSRHLLLNHFRSIALSLRGK